MPGLAAREAGKMNLQHFPILNRGRWTLPSGEKEGMVVGGRVGLWVAVH